MYDLYRPWKRCRKVVIDKSRGDGQKQTVAEKIYGKQKRNRHLVKRVTIPLYNC